MSVTARAAQRIALRGCADATSSAIWSSAAPGNGCESMRNMSTQRRSCSVMRRRDGGGPAVRSRGTRMASAPRVESGPIPSAPQKQELSTRRQAMLTTVVATRRARQSWSR